MENGPFIDDLPWFTYIPRLWFSISYVTYCHRVTRKIPCLIAPSCIPLSPSPQGCHLCGKGVALATAVLLRERIATGVAWNHCFMVVFNHKDQEKCGELIHTVIQVHQANVWIFRYFQHILKWLFGVGFSVLLPGTVYFGARCLETTQKPSISHAAALGGLAARIHQATQLQMGRAPG